MSYSALTCMMLSYAVSSLNIHRMNHHCISHQSMCFLCLCICLYRCVIWSLQKSRWTHSRSVVHRGPDGHKHQIHSKIRTVGGSILSKSGWRERNTWQHIQPFSVIGSRVSSQAMENISSTTITCGSGSICCMLTQYQNWLNSLIPHHSCQMFWSEWDTNIPTSFPGGYC